MIDYGNLESVEHDGSHLTGKQVAKIEKYVATLQRLLGLAQWQVVVGTDLPPEGAVAMIEAFDGTRRAVLCVKIDWWETTGPGNKRADLLHEVLHLAHHDASAVIRRFKEGNGDIGEYAWSLVWDQFSLNTEAWVDGLSLALAPLMPEWK